GGSQLGGRLFAHDRQGMVKATGLPFPPLSVRSAGCSGLTPMGGSGGLQAGCIRPYPAFPRSVENLLVIFSVLEQTRIVAPYPDGVPNGEGERSRIHGLGGDSPDPRWS